MMEWMLLPYKRYADFSGRSRRKEYWMFFLLWAMVSAAFAIAFFLQLPWSAMMNPEPGVSPFEGFEPGAGIFVIGGLMTIFVLGSIVPSIAVAVRRFHDQDMSGWFVLLFAVLQQIPFVGLIAAIANLVFMARKGTHGSNRFGSDPLDSDLGDVFS